MKLLLETDKESARTSAIALKELNSARKELTVQGVNEAKKQMEEYLNKGHRNNFV